MPYQNARGTRLYYELDGPETAPAVVFINGIFQDTSGWQFAVRDLRTHFRTLAYDCKGQGRSDKPEAGPYYTADHAAELLTLLDALGIAHAHFVGLSNGGMILMHVARLAPERVDKLVFADTFAYLDPVQQAMMRSWRAALTAGGSALRFDISMPWTWGSAYLERNLDAVLALRDKAAQLPAHSGIHLIDGVINHDARPWLPSIHAPALIVHGEHDRMAPPHSVAVLHAHLPHARVHWLADAGHAAWLEQHAAFNHAVLDFLVEPAT
jgi:3-oxoadipate enol-lactonase